MITVGAFDAKTRLSALLELVEKGEEVVITRRGKPVARLVREGGGARTPERQAEIEATVAELLALREKLGPVGEGWRDLRDEGRKY
jgi:antitoxin (DNA-binding transcriptional repressor) of toxin-antitoxin stability system